MAALWDLAGFGRVGLVLSKRVGYVVFMDCNESDAALDGDTRNSYVALRAFPHRCALGDDLQTCFSLLTDLDPAEHLHVWPHLAEAMLAVEDIMAAVEPPALF